MRFKSHKMLTVGDLELYHNDVEILNGIAIGKTDRSIALEIELSKRTVEARVVNMAQILGVKGRTAIICKALALGIIKNPFEK